ncbi:5'-methylthioadenosine/adenosylhomocysteine nucleosidase [Fusobacterium ulcerans]|uniref:adenosylhomocysteine nucleosidase n=1 Tax=Fusobacterium ulcerans TaxID=861 RepID=A0AAX2J7H4_9FUSO|nr:5'-methylthioadenosine/adenosylhomocysteine nucleosidase [Fusobacterium ulcerans]AVQ28499.1 5'-methylthioadenosine/adenosylhomocysteine nucleosidase [Fusobacterium ulcerans]EFS25967.1 MTA/SAH nucleosidase [Fusobacterium ulcerans ATCC 49185]SQJ00353.1 5'-methylthioadenosine/S-adenosylhomocysteine nucleosidase [Fusobacterium ulcerans]
MALKVGIICAGDSELEPFLNHIHNCHITEKAMLKFYEGEINNIPVVVLYSGVCKVNAAVAAQILIDSYHVNTIISAGTAGGMEKTIKIFDTVISTQLAYHDVADDILVEFHPWLPSIYFNADEKLLAAAKKIVQNQAVNHPVIFGKMVTGESFIDKNMREIINKKYAPLSVDMESASIAHVCYVNNIPFISIRTITDTASHSGVENFEQNCDKASIISKDIVLAVLEELKNDL